MAEEKILIVEDDALTALGIQNRLEDLGYKVLAIAASGDTALKMVEELRPDLVLMDIKLQGEMDGIQTANQINQLHHIPVIYLTAYSDEETLQRAKVTDPLGYLLKPVRQESLKSTLEIVLYKTAMAEKLQETKELFHLAFENANVGMCLVDLEGRLTRVNPQMSKIFGYSQAELESMTVNDIAHPEDVDISPAFISHAKSGEIEQTIFEKRYFHRDGHIVWGQVSSSLVRDLQGNPRYFISHVQDITEERLAQENLKSSENRYRDLVENCQELICTHDLDGYFLSVNPWVSKVLGYPINEILHKNVVDFLTPESREEFPAYLANIQRDKTVKGSLAIQTRSGEIRVLEYNNNLRTQGVITPIVRCIAHDITEHLQADIALKESERQYRTILDSLGDSIHVVDEELNFVFINQNFLKWNQELNLTTDVIGKGIFDVFPFLPKKVLDEYKQVFKDNEVLVTEEITILHDQEIYTETRKIPLLRENKVDQVVTVVRDITERKKSEHTLQESEERFRYIFDTAAVAIWEEDFSQAVAVIDDLKSGGVKDFRQYLDENPQAIVQAMQMIKILDINQQTLDMYGAKSKDELLASLDKISVPETHEIIKEELIAIAEGRRFFAGETVNKTLQGKRIDVLLTMSLPEHASEFDSVLVSVMDITKSKQAERALQESEARYRQIIETAQEGIWIIDSENKTTFVNQKIAEMLDYTTEEMIGVPIFAFMADESKAFSDDFTDRRRQGLVEQQDLNFKCKNGATLWAIVSTSSLFNDKGVYTGALVMMTDITSRKKAEGMLRHFSTHDVLTGLYNRAFFEEQVSRLEQERDFPVSIVVADIDDLKVTNDLHGHAAGDELLRQVAQSLTSAFRREDIIARIGGDEFAVLLPNANQEGVKKILRRIKDNVQAYNAAHQDIPFNLSLGTSVVKIGDSLSEAIKRADKKMYLEKHGKKR